jgi:hypothetical protein
MTSNKRGANLERDLESAQTHFAEQLVTALRRCAAGHWGLFGQNGERWDEGQVLAAQGCEISELRKRLGYTEGFELFDRFMAYRRRNGPNDPGEPKLAQKFLAELGKDDSNGSSR